jgi:hypothetical protein
MLTVQAETQPHSLRYAATDPVDPIRTFNIPISPFKPPRVKEDETRQRRQRKEQSQDETRPSNDRHEDEGHIDDYA